MKTTMRMELQEPADASLICSTSLEPLNNMSLQTNSNPVENSKFYSPCVREYNPLNKREVCSRVFVLDVNGSQLTPCTPKRAKRLMKQNKAIPKWNKFGEFGIQMLVDTRKETPETILGIDNGTKFEGYSVICDKTNNFNVMWKLPDKKKLVKKLEERRQLRRARRFRNCRRRECRFDNREKKEFIAPSQLQIVNSRLKAIKELFKCYPISKVAFEDVNFNHRDKHYGKNFSTVEIGKNKIKNFIVNKIGRKNLLSFEGRETQALREKYNLRKTSDKSKENFYSHCVDSFVIALSVMDKQVILNENITFVDDSYRCIRRKLYDTQYSKGNIRYPFSTGNFKGIMKGCILGTKEGWLGQLVGGTKDNVWYQDFEVRNGRKVYQKGKDIKKIDWISHSYKYNKIKGQFIPHLSQWNFLSIGVD